MRSVLFFASAMNCHTNNGTAINFLTTSLSSDLFVSSDLVAFERVLSFFFFFSV
eukprot:m.29712 g.29712  ORF g.29712 m.29712 type:complete len:54 (-) comp10543_c0_seq1:192-353(-)